MKYSRDEAKFLLENYNNIRFECNDFLLNAYQPGDKSEVSNQKTGRENERNLIKKLDDKQYQEKNFKVYWQLYEKSWCRNLQNSLC